MPVSIFIGVMTMALLIFESIGMSELVLIGIVALIIFGPRKLPQLARKAGKTMNDLRKATGEFKETWEKEVDLSELEEVQTEKTVSRPTTFNATESTDVIEMPKVSTSTSKQPMLFEATEEVEEKQESLPNTDHQTDASSNKTEKGEWF